MDEIHKLNLGFILDKMIKISKKEDLSNKSRLLFNDRQFTYMDSSYTPKKSH